MEDECNVICDKCGADTPAHSSMSHPEDNSGDLCFECYDNLSYEWDLKRGTAWLTLHLPSMDDFMVEYRKVAKTKKTDTRCTEGNCHGASMALVNLCKKKKLNIELQRGHWLGGDVREERENFPMQQHSWTRIRLDNNNVAFIVDPTQWVFVGGEPSFGITDEDDKRYDLGSYTTRRIFLGETSIPERKGNTIKSKLSKKAQEWLNNISPRDWSVWTNEEMIKIANMDPRGMTHIKEVFKAIIACGNRGFIPLDGLTMVGL